MKRSKGLRLAVLPNKRKCCCTPTTCICKAPEPKLSKADIKKLKALIKKLIAEVTAEIMDEARRR